MSWSSCPRCGSRCEVRDTREDNGYVRRRICCLGVGRHRFTTIELILPNHIAPSEVAALFRNMPHFARALFPLTQLLRSLDPWQKKK